MMYQLFEDSIMPKKQPIPYCVIYTDKQGNNRKTEAYTAQIINMVADEYKCFSGLYIMDDETGEIFGISEKVPMYR